MNCNETRLLIDADVDGELDLLRHLEITAHLRTCTECASYAGQAKARRSVLRDSLPRFTAPSQLAARIRAVLYAEGASSATSAVSSPRRAKVYWPLWNVAGMAASIGFALLVGFTWGNARARSSLLVDEAVNDHVRSLQSNHLTDVASTDQHTVKPWFAGKIDFAPPVTDLGAAGFPLTGGRLEHIDGRPAAALVFHRRQHAINLFIWPANTAAISARQSARNGYNTVSWSQDGLNFLAVSEIPSGELDQFTAAFRASAP